METHSFRRVSQQFARNYDRSSRKNSQGKQKQTSQENTCARDSFFIKLCASALTRKTSVFSFIIVNLVNKNILHALITTGVWGEGRGWSHLISAFSKTGKKFPNFGKKCPDCGHLLVNFSFKMHFWSFSRRKPPTFFPAGPVFFMV